MRLIAWNANYNNKRRSLEETVALLEPLRADILVLSEVAQPGPDNPLVAHWFGDKGPGLAVIARNGLNLTAHPANGTAPGISAGFEVNGDSRFNLVAAWPVQRRDGPSYHEILMAALGHYSGLLHACPAFLVGDLNSSSRVIGQRRSHQVFVEAARSLGLVSAYHSQTGESHGEETVPTYVHHSGAARAFHLDYCFVSSLLIDQVKLNILNTYEWSGRSDHYPVMVDVADRIMKESGVLILAGPSTRVSLRSDRCLLELRHPPPLPLPLPLFQTVSET